MHSYIKYWIAGIGALLIIMIAGMTVHQKHPPTNIAVSKLIYINPFLDLSIFIDVMLFD